MDGFMYLIKNDLNRELDLLIEKERKLSLTFKGVICRKCRIRQGFSHNKIKEYYCQHISSKIDRKLVKESKRMFNKVIAFEIGKSIINKQEDKTKEKTKCN